MLCPDVALLVASRRIGDTRGRLGLVENDAMDGAHSAASMCQRVVALKRTTIRGAVRHHAFKYSA
jgi:hypothetical protein